MEQLQSKSANKPTYTLFR